ncbi:MAG: hypothetical protein ABIG96_00330 [Candidatus Micrarchaeota archaeon]
MGNIVGSVLKVPSGKHERSLIILLTIIALPIIGFGIYEIFANDLLRVESDVPSHAIRGYFFAENPNFVREWYLGADIFKYYPPVPIWVSGIFYILVPQPGFSLSVLFLLCFIAIIGVSGLIAKQLQEKFIQGAFAGLMLLASYPSISRYVNGGRFGDLLGMVFFLSFAAMALSYYNKPTKKRMVALMGISLFAMLTHFLSGLLVLSATGLIFAYSLYKKDPKARNVFLIALAGAAPSILFWVPFYLQANQWVAGSGVFTANTHYDLRHTLFYLLIIINLFLLIRKRPIAAYAIAFLLLVGGAYKLDSFSVVFKENFDGLEMDAPYSTIDGYAGPAIWSVLAYKGFVGDYGSYDPGAPPEVVERFLALNRTDCKSLDEYSGITGVKYFITNQTDLERCGYALVWEGKNDIYDYSADFNGKVPLLAAANESVYSAKLRVYKKEG